MKGVEIGRRSTSRRLPSFEKIGDGARDGLRRKLPRDIGAGGLAEAPTQLRLGGETAQPVGGIVDICLGPELTVGDERAVIGILHRHHVVGHRRRIAGRS